MNTINTTYSSAGNAHAEPSFRESRQEKLENDIDRQRDHIGGLLDAIESKLSPGEMFERVLGYSKSGGREFASNLGDTVKANPMPTLLAAAGLVWLYANKDSTARTQTAGARNGSYSYSDRADNDPDDDSSIRQHARKAREGISGKASDVKDRAGDAAHDAMDTAREKARQANQGFHHMLEDNPMAIGAMGIAVGALLGAMLPSTSRENELLGEASDNVTDEAKSLGKRVSNRVARVGTEVTTPQDSPT